jgi:NADH dehydrogenase
VIDSSSQKMILVTGATGFVGRHVVAGLHRAGFAVRILVRPSFDIDSVPELMTLTHDIRRGVVMTPETLRGVCSDCFAVIHLVGIINETHSTFEDVHVRGTRTILDEAKSAGVKRFIYLSGLGTRPSAAARYHQSKYAAEQSVLASGLEGYNFPSSVIFGSEDVFLNLFIKFAQNRFNPRYPPWPLMPLIAGGISRVQPIWVEDVADILARACCPEFSQKRPPGTYEIGGPEVLTIRQIMNVACAVAHQKRIYISVPRSIAWLIASVLEKVSSHPLLTRDQLSMLAEDGRVKNNWAAEILGRAPKKLWDYAKGRYAA